MLDMLVKENLGNSAHVFNDDQHDSAEFNSTNSEIKNLITQQGGTLTPLVDFLTDDEFMMNKAVIAAGGWVMPSLSASVSEVVFTSGAAGVNNFPGIEQFADKLLTFITGVTTNTGAYTVDYDGSGSLPLVDLDGAPLISGALPANTVAQIFYDSSNVEWVLKASGISSLYFNGNGGVIFPGDEITDFCANTRNFQIGARGMLSAEDDPDFDVWFGYNAYCQTGSSPDQFEKIQTSEWAGRSLWDVANGRYVQQYSLDSDLDSDFTFRDGWGMTEKGDFFYGESANIGVASDADWTYMWHPKNKVAARSKEASANDFTFRGTNIYPTGTDPTLHVVATGDWEFTIESPFGGKFWYKGTGTALDTFALISIQLSNTITQFVGGDFSKKNVTLMAPVALGGLMTVLFLDGEPEMVQHQLGFMSNLQTAEGIDSGFHYDVWGSGFYTNRLFGDNTINLFFNASLDTDAAGRALSFTREGYIVGIGGSGGNADSHVTVKDPDDIVSQVDPTVDEFQPLGAINNQAEDAVFYVEGVSAGSNILRSVDDGSTWEKVQDNGSLQTGGLSRANDGTIIAVRFTSGRIDPRPLYSVDNGDNWILGLAVPDIDYSATPVGFGNIYQIFAQHPDGEFFFTGPDDIGGQTVLYEAATIGGSWALVGNVDGASSNGDRGCLFIDQFNGAIYVGIADSGEFAAIRRSTNKGVTFTTVYTAPASFAGFSSVNKIMQTPEGVLYAVLRETTSASLIIRSVDNGLTWDELVSTSVVLRDMVYAPTDNALYTIRDNSTGGVGFRVDRYPTEFEFATVDDSLPTKIRQTDGKVDVSIAKESVDTDNQISFGIPVISFARKAIGILKNVGAAIVAAEAAIGGFFRNLDDDNYIWWKDLDGSTFPLNNSLPPMQLTAGFFTPDPVNTGGFATIEIGAGATRGSYDILNFADTGTDYYYSQVAPPKNWTSRRIIFRVSFILEAGISLPATIGWALAVRALVANTITTNTWTEITHEIAVPSTGADYWRKTTFSGELELAAFDPGEDTLNVRLTRDNSVTNNEPLTARFSEVEIKWVR